jgi:hypothetical protein
MVAGCENCDGHLVLADWLEENLGLADLAATLRDSRNDPRGKKEDPDHSAFFGFRYRLLDPHVLLYMTHCRVWRPGTRGPLEGYVVGLAISPASALSPRCWSHWLVGKDLPDPGQRLWDDLGKTRPAMEGDY